MPACWTSDSDSQVSHEFPFLRDPCLTADVADDPQTYRCPDCPKEGMPYKVETHATTALIYVRCIGCGLAWTVQQSSSVRE